MAYSAIELANALFGEVAVNHYNRLKYKIAQEQRDWTDDDLSVHCAFCDRVVREADLHHWNIKRSDGVTVNTPENVILLCRSCHEKYGQTREGKELARQFKRSKGYKV